MGKKEMRMERIIISGKVGYYLTPINCPFYSREYPYTEKIQHVRKNGSPHAVYKLDELIEMYQEMEKQSSGPASGNKQSSNPAASSALPEGDGSVGTLNRKPSLADRWGNMRDVDRKKIEADASMPRHLLTEAGIGYRFVL